ncbi:MAG: hypothetical protein QME78_11235 [Thermodesulfobacteriota bacterium]|nr:hypothetical protein [Thermodesulfobacteriota bacterium]
MQKEILALKKELLTERLVRIEAQFQLLQNVHAQTKGELEKIEILIKEEESAKV